MWTKPAFAQLQQALADPANAIGMRMRAAYYLRQEHQEQPGNSDNVEQGRQLDVVAVLSKALQNKGHGSLMRHELAYVLGQIRDLRGIQCLQDVLQDDNDCVMVRHECAEALGAILQQQQNAATTGSSTADSVYEDNIIRHKKTTLDIMQRVCDNTQTTHPELAETCQLAKDVIEWRNRGGDATEADHGAAPPPPLMCACMESQPFSTVDPAPPLHPAHASLTTEEIGGLLCDADQPLFDRYRAMFSLRNRGGSDAVLQLCRALTTDTTSCLFRHEVAYVLGQLQHPTSLEALETLLRRQNEHQMVRHEAAEALGAIEDRWTDVERILQEFAHDDDVVVRESCLVALDAADYWGRGCGSGTPSAADVDKLSLDAVGETVTTTTTDEKLGVHSFAQQKADRQQPQGILNHHFNVKN